MDPIDGDVLASRQVELRPLSVSVASRGLHNTNIP